MKALLDKIFAAVGSLCPWIYRTGGSSLFLIFPFFHEGKQERACLEIARALADRCPVIAFMAPSKNEVLRSEFEKCGTVCALMPGRDFWTRRMKAFRLAALKAAILKTPGVLVFGVGCTDFYRELLQLAPKGVCFQDALLESFATVNIQNVHYLDARFVMDQETCEDMEFIYRLNDAEKEYFPRVHKITEWEEIKQYFSSKDVS